MALFPNETARTLTQCALLAAVGLGAGLWFWGELPEPMPIHWDASGRADGFAPRWLGISIGPMLSLFLPLLMLGLGRLDPRRAHVERASKHLHTILVALSALGLGIQTLTLHAAMSPDMALSPLLLWVSVGGVFLVLGNAMPKFGSNFFIGVRTPWTLSSERVWRRTQRVGGIMFVAAGAAILCMALLGVPPVWLSRGVLALAMLAALVPAGYSYWLWREEQV